MRASSASSPTAGFLPSAGGVLAAEKPTDAPIAYLAGEIDIKAARQALDMLRAHRLVNDNEVHQPHAESPAAKIR